MQTSRRNGFSLIELLIVIAIILILAAIAVPKYNQVRMTGYETAAIQAIKTIHAVETQYYSQFGRYAVSLTELGPPSGGTPGPQAADMISGDLASGIKGGFKFTVTGTATGYTVTAVPVAYNNTGRRSFYSDQTMLIRNHWGPETASPESPEIK